MSSKFKFNDICGENVQLYNEKTVAVWTLVNSQGLAFSETELQPGDFVEVKVKGNGRCDVGFIMGKKKPCNFKHTSEIRVKGRTCIIEIQYNEDGNEVSDLFRYLEIHYNEVGNEVSDMFIQKYTTMKSGTR